MRETTKYTQTTSFAVGDWRSPFMSRFFGGAELYYQQQRFHQSLVMAVEVCIRYHLIDF